MSFEQIITCMESINPLLLRYRQGVRMLRDPYSSKPFVEFYHTARVGGDVVNFEAIKLQKIST
ncbi:MAG: family phage major capsid protein [Vampirovibrio sp.]|nr:family phage major capsid protein [Vampirovibrio sp.]